ncbi:MAG: amidohydrolase [Treponema sp.]|nr:amidohydrolase [Treponema sp.]
MKTVLRHARVLCMNDSLDYYPDGYLVFEDDTIRTVGEESSYNVTISQGATYEYDMHGDIVMPSFINTHTHLGMTSFRSLGDDMKDRLTRFLFPLENKCMTKDLVYASSCISIAEMLLSGTSTALDMYYFEKEAIKSASDMHFRLWAGETLLDAPHCDGDGFEAGMAYINEMLPLQSDMIHVVAAPHAPYSVCEDNLKKVQAFCKANNLLWSMHVSEMPSENTKSRERYGVSPIRHLANCGILDDNLIAAHCIFTDDADMDPIHTSGCSVSHCAVSNAKAAKGVAPIDAMIKHGIPVTLGTDGPSSGNTLDMFTQMKSAVILQKNLLQDRSAMSAKEIVKLATSNGGKVLKAPIGQLKAGYKADILVLETRMPNMIPIHDIYAVIVYSAQAQNVKHLWINGTQVVQNRQLTMTDYSSLVKNYEQATELFNSNIAS